MIACTLAAALAKFPVQRTALTLFPPVSERDQAGIDELETQTTNLLSFRPIEQTIFDAQVAFNLLSAYGMASKPSLADTRKEIAHEVAGYLSNSVSIPAIQLVQAPVFYGYAFSAFVELAEPVASTLEIEAALADCDVSIAAPDDLPPTNVSVAGESRIHVARVDPDPNSSTGVWIWGVADNLRMAATNAVRIAEELLAKSQVA